MKTILELQNDFMQAAATGDLELMQKTLAHNPLAMKEDNPNFHGYMHSRNEQGRTALMIAAARGDKPMVDFLLKYQPIKNDINAVDNQGLTALTIAASKKGHESIVKTLIFHGAIGSQPEDIARHYPMPDAIESKDSHENTHQHKSWVAFFKRKEAKTTPDIDVKTTPAQNHQH